ncbi:hypothetical protein W02_02050 [Nitrospira sp. KM1]|uniref:hypothetical protein n=1 Tax=Nitrospira sp. KM1 TaxID=1936990 RepID=UPI0013A7A750|nr:hypothetical protein [Nitrospira sp. KM1]BCA53065.1 hypothetical protein W02_02050 [Nitrospira sp. KM1]
MRTHVMAALMIAGLAVATVGCTSYYRVTDPASGKTYYTTKIDDTRGGAVKIKDDKSGSTVTLHSSEVKQISSDEYEAALKPPPPPVQK